MTDTAKEILIPTTAFTYIGIVAEAKISDICKQFGAVKDSFTLCHELTQSKHKFEIVKTVYDDSDTFVLIALYRSNTTPYEIHLIA